MAACTRMVTATERCGHPVRATRTRRQWLTWPQRMKWSSRMAHVTLTSTDSNYAHHISNGRHALTADEPATLGGQDTGMAPFDLYLASLAACTAITLRMYAEKKG